MSKSKSKWSISLVLSFLLLMFLGTGIGSQTVNASTTTVFEDVPDSYWAKDEIEYLYGKSIISGFEISSQRLFKPENPVTRGEAAKMIINSIGQTELNAGTSSYSDVTGTLFAGYIERASELGIINGYKDGTFRPDEILNRAQMSKIIVNAFGLDQSAAANLPRPFADVSPDSEFASYIQTLYYEGISQGSNNLYEPYSDVKRSHMAAFISRAMDDSFKVAVQPVPEPAPSITTYGKVTVNSLNVRSNPSSTAPILGALPKGTVVTVLDINGYWAKINYNNQAGYVNKTYLKLKNANGSVLQDRVIVVDPGHGGTDPGTSSGSLQEKNITLAVGKLVAAKLENDGAKVVMTRTGDTYPELQDRVDTAWKAYAELFVSIHVNSATASASGTETFYDTSQNANGSESYALAQEIQKQIIALVGMNDRGTKDNDFYVLRNQNIPSVLVELGFLSNSGDAAKLSSPEYQELYAEAIFRGIKNYYSK